jgi:hypothetical protein
VPTLYLTNAATVGAVNRARMQGREARPEMVASKGRGIHWTIMATPRIHYGELGSGRVKVLAPSTALRSGILSGELAEAAYRDGYIAQLNGARIAPGELLATVEDTGENILVQDGDTLTCACSRASAAAGRCHRVWAAEALTAAGWTCIVDGALR